MKKLLPCPFCNCNAVIARIGTNRHSTIVECTNCGCTLENGETHNHGEAWNTRAPAASPWVKITPETMPPDNADIFIWDGMRAGAGYTENGKLCFCDRNFRMYTTTATHYMLIEAPEGE